MLIINSSYLLVRAHQQHKKQYAILNMVGQQESKLTDVQVHFTDKFKFLVCLFFLFSFSVIIYKVTA